jgi:hypothetical protein
MGKVVWSEGFDKKSHKKEIRGKKNEIVRKSTGKIVFVKDIQRPSASFVEEDGRMKHWKSVNSVRRDHVFPGALVKLVGEAKRRYGETFCHVLSEADASWQSDYETTWGGRWWLVILPSGLNVVVNSKDLVQLDPQNGNPEDQQQ